MSSPFHKWTFFYSNFWSLQGFSQLNLTPFEAGRVLTQAAHRLGIPQIPDEYLKEGRLGEILIPDDYKPLPNVSRANYTFDWLVYPGYLG